MQLRGKPRKKWLDNLIGFGLQLVIVSFKRRNVHGPNLMEIAFKRHQNLTVTCLRSPQNLSQLTTLLKERQKKRHCLAAQSYYLCAGLTSLMSVSLFLKTVLLTQTPYRVIKYLCTKIYTVGELLSQL